MPNIAHSIEDLIGNTPLLEARRYAAARGLEARVLLKLEYLNPAGSVKDRAALSMIEEAERSGRLSPGAVIVEPTSGNTGIGLAAIAVPRGYRVVLTMPESMSAERRSLLRAYGAELVLTPAAEGMSGAIRRAQALCEELPGAFLAGQFVNPANPAAHYASTGPEIWRDTAGVLDWFVAGVGTGGTLTGIGRYLKEQDPAIQVAAAEPAGSAVLSGEAAGPHGLQGIGAGFVPEILDTDVYDCVEPVTEEQAYEAARVLVRSEGILTGISSGAALYAAIQLAKREENKGKTIVVLLPDNGDRYYSTPLFAK